MALDLSNWDTTVRASVIQAFAESAIVPDESYDRRVHTNQASLVFPKISKRFAQNKADGTILTPNTPGADPAVSLALDQPLKLHDYLPYSAMNTQQATLEGDWAERLGRDLRRGQDNRFIAFSIQCAIGGGTTLAPDSGVFWETGVGFTTDDQKAEAAANVIRDILKKFADNQVPDNERKYIIVTPEIFFDSLRSQMLRSRDFTQDSNNAGQLSRIQFGEATIMRAVSIFDTDQDGTSDTELFGAPAKYLDDYSEVSGTSEGVHGVGWAGPSSLGVGFVETLNTRVSDSPEHESVLVNARLQMGTACKQDEGFVSVVKTVNV